MKLSINNLASWLNNQHLDTMNIFKLKNEQGQYLFILAATLELALEHAKTVTADTLTLVEAVPPSGLKKPVIIFNNVQ